MNTSVYIGLSALYMLIGYPHVTIMTAIISYWLGCCIFNLCIMLLVLLVQGKHASLKTLIIIISLMFPVHIILLLIH